MPHRKKWLIIATLSALVIAIPTIYFICTTTGLLWEWKLLLSGMMVMAGYVFIAQWLE